MLLLDTIKAMVFYIVKSLLIVNVLGYFFNTFNSVQFRMIRTIVIILKK